MPADTPQQDAHEQQQAVGGDEASSCVRPLEIILGDSHATRQLQLEISMVAPTSATVFIRGETGTGKELVANAIQRSSPRRSANYVKLNCAAFSENILESELFGHERGSFTGAYDKRVGHFETADRGTVFLDEIGEMPLSMQPKFLRVLQEREIVRVGSSKRIKVDVRIMAATNQDLKKLVNEGKFREDLYFRLNRFGVYVPPLRDRTDDILVLASSFYSRYSADYFKKPGHLKISPQALLTMKSYTWPGNVRELDGMMEWLAIVKKGASVLLEKRDINEYFVSHNQDAAPTLYSQTAINFGLFCQQQFDYASSGRLSIADMNSNIRLQSSKFATETTGGNISKAAEIFNTERKTIYNHLGKSLIPPSETSQVALEDRIEETGARTEFLDTITNSAARVREPLKTYIGQFLEAPSIEANSYLATGDLNAIRVELVKERLSQIPDLREASTSMGVSIAFVERMKKFPSREKLPGKLHPFYLLGHLSEIDTHIVQERLRINGSLEEAARTLGIRPKIVSLMARPYAQQQYS